MSITESRRVAWLCSINFTDEKLKENGKGKNNTHTTTNRAKSVNALPRERK